ncbi:phosphate ABC transporter membrane protein 2, PhoT family [Halomicrobium zhouii]|uniref:Phosphate transport system permease protein PstA n=1 Tax=Halomicrobium zhouii TaxID=767519 RepID=A0A1I6KS10_9EURY|nr:phosphate ABC transporter permease PstA [Halomicrobium zhouii]SFR93700.1 phosphate ABC transporter membrane protein 2, PhoT family [Halomicrobium zhouii]
MATDTATDDGFGQVSRVKGVVFEYLTLAASLLGIVSLAILLAYVSYDAFGLDAAAPAWYVVFLLTLVAPTAGFLWYVSGRPAARSTISGVLSVILGGTLVALALVVVLSIIVGSDVWFAHSLFILGPTLALLGYARYVDDTAAWAGTTAGAWLFVGAFLTALDDLLLVIGQQLASPFDVLTMPEELLLQTATLLGTPGVYFLTVLVPAVVLADRYVASRTTDRRGHSLAAALVLVAFAAVPVVDGLPAVSRGSWLLVVVGFLTPLGAYVALNAGDSDRRLGLAFPLVVLAGLFAGRLVVDVLGVAQPEPWFDWQLLTSPASATPADAGLYPAIIGSVFIIVLVALFTVVFGVGAAVFLEEYAASSGPVGKLTRFIQVNISNLAGVPSVVYGLLGLALFLRLIGMGAGTVIVAALTLSLLILPIVIISAQEALRSVPDDMRQASYGMGATRWQVIKTVVLPEALPGILTGTILALGRAIGETAPLILIGIASFVTWAPDGIFSRVTAMPMQIYSWAFYPDPGFRHGVVPAGVITLLAVLLAMNSVAIFVRNRYERST